MKKWKIAAYSLLFLGLLVSCNSSKPQTVNTESGTKSEKFLIRKGSLVIKDFYKIGIFLGIYEKKYNGVMFFAMMLTDVGTGEKMYGAQLIQHGESVRDQVGVFDFDELGSMQDALDYMINKTSTVADKDSWHTEVVFESRGGLSTGIYISPRDKEKPAEQIGFLKFSGNLPDTTVKFEINKMKELRTLVSQAREKLVALGAK